MNMDESCSGTSGATISVVKLKTSQAFGRSWSVSCSRQNWAELGTAGITTGGQPENQLSVLTKSGDCLILFDIFGGISQDDFVGQTWPTSSSLASLSDAKAPGLGDQ